MHQWGCSAALHASNTALRDPERLSCALRQHRVFYTNGAARGSDMSDVDTPPAAGEGGEGATPPAADPRIAELSRESAGYRTQRNEAVRRAHAYETMLKAHGVDLSGVTAERLADIPISGGKADGPWAYTPPKVEVPREAPKSRVEGKAALTLDEVRAWGPDEINRRWDEVKSLMAKR